MHVLQVVSLRRPCRRPEALGLTAVDFHHHRHDQ